MKFKVTAVIEQDALGYYAYCPELEGCQSQGDTFEEVLVNIKEAVHLYVSWFPSSCLGTPLEAKLCFALDFELADIM